MSWDRNKQKLDSLRKVKAELPPHPEARRSSKGSPFPPASVNDSHGLLYVKMQLVFCSGLISLNNWDPERLVMILQIQKRFIKCEKQWESVAVT